jgi:hypothetical protein
VSGANGGSLGKGGRGRFTPNFESAMYSLKPGELSQAVLTPFGWHLIRVDSKSGDTLDVRHILVSIGQSDSSATRTDRRADSLASKAGSQEDPKTFDAAAKMLSDFAHEDSLDSAKVEINLNCVIDFGERILGVLNVEGGSDDLSDCACCCHYFLCLLRNLEERKNSECERNRPRLKRCELRRILYSISSGLAVLSPESPSLLCRLDPAIHCDSQAE